MSKMNDSLRLLIIDDNPDDRALTIRELKKEFEIQAEQIIDAEGFAHALGEGTFDIVITDYQLRWSNGLEILGRVKSHYPDCIVIMFTATGDEEIAVEAMKKGLDDYVLKSPKHFKRLPVAVKAATKKAQQRQRLREAEEALQESEEHYRQLVELCPDIVAVHSEGKIVFINSAGARLIGAAKPEQLIEKPIMDFVHPDYREIIKERVREMRKKRRAVPLIEEKFIRLDGTYIDVEVAAMPFIYQDKQAVQVVARDISKRKRAEEKIQASLREKEVLLKEIHHRVKNNLQIISSLLDLSRRRTENQEAVDLLSDARAKVHTMALIHAQLYQSDRFDRIDMGRHIQELFNFLAAIYETKSRFVTYLAKPSDVSLELTQAIPCALVLNEVISNAFKHAFKEGEKGTIEASIQRTADDTIVIRVKDDGKGIPEEIDIDNTNGLGLKLARNLIQSQLGGRIRVEGNGGTEIVIEFNASK